MTRKEKIRTALRNTFKSFTNLKKTVKTELIEDLIGYNIDERSNELQHISLEKWTCRKQGIKYDRTERGEKTPNLCKNQPRALIKYINMQTSLCPTCKDKKIVARCSKEHLESIHNYEITDVYEITRKVTDLTEKQKNKDEKKGRESQLSRKRIVEYAEKLIQPNVQKLKQFLNKAVNE